MIQLKDDKTEIRNLLPINLLLNNAAKITIIIDAQKTDIISVEVEKYIIPTLI
ncbi:hypothetical protein KIMC2_03540 [Xylocopilactobacillus apis]|uniref:Uncharacterized protein n=1 Tax=Xylocopilactobacillus apis TaxID=2932183 RepID=A0AAU9CPA8_9LACO|nr:hypothetical protein KIMC2_03540 [Xylocopilactobacillus apis]